MLNHCIQKKIPDKHSTIPMNGLKGGPMRAILSTSRYTALMHGLTRQKGKHAGGYKSFTFTYPHTSFINTHTYRYEASEKRRQEMIS